MALPLVGIVCDRRGRGEYTYDAVEEEYIAAVAHGAGATPLLVPNTNPPLAPEAVLPALDGLLFTGSVTNVAPHRYNGPPPRPGTRLDEARDATVLPLLRAALERGVPLFCICRGFQELNVALGGTLHQHLHELPGRIDHRAPENAPLEEKYRLRHTVRLTPGGMLARLLADAAPGGTLHVNSLHGQGIDRLAPGLDVEALSPDGVVEAVSHKDAKGFLVGVQWHPEWDYAADRASAALFAAFGEAVCSFAQSRRG